MGIVIEQLTAVLLARSICFIASAAVKGRLSSVSIEKYKVQR